MSTFECPLVRVGPVEKHANADSLGITKVGEYPVIVRLDGLREGDLAVYVPVDALCPPTGATAFLADPHRPTRPVRVKAKRLRGVFSMGLLLPYKGPDGIVGADCASALGITKWEEPEPMSTPDEDESAPSGVFSPVFDVENWRSNSSLIADGEPVVVTEKIHGCNARYLWHDGALHMASRIRWKRASVPTVWSRAADADGLAEKLSGRDGFIVYGECYGQVQDLKYGQKSAAFVAFDVWNWREAKWLDAADAAAWCGEAQIPMVPVLYRGPWSREAVEGVVRGPTVLGNGANIREGVVIRPAIERTDVRLGRVILKWVSEDYLLRKNGTEHK